MHAARTAPIARALVLLVSVPIALAGCVAPEAPDTEEAAAPAPPSLERLLPHLDLADTHNHTDPAQHRAGWNLEIVGHDKLADSWENVGRYNQVVLRGDRAYVSAYAVPPSQLPGLIIVNVSDPTAPQIEGTVTTPETTPIDVFLSTDGRYAFLASHRENPSVALPSPPQSCTGTPLVNACVPFVPYGVTVVDVQDPARPTVVSTYRSAPSGAHTVKAHAIGGTEYVFIASYGLMALNRLAPGVEIAKLVEGGPGGGPHLEFVARYMMPTPPTDGSGFVHDMWIAEHPATNATLMYVAHWDAGVRIVDVSDPSRPKEIAAWNDFDAATYGNIHFVQPATTLVEGRHLTIAAPEYGSAEHQGKMWLIDTTDPTAPKSLGEWEMPGEGVVSECCYRYSPHNFDLKDGFVVYGHYHGGVWVLDVSTPEKWEAPVVIGYRTTVPPDETAVLKESAPNVWNALWRDDGLIVASDIGSGLYVLELGTRDPGQPPYERLL